MQPQSFVRQAVESLSQVELFSALDEAQLKQLVTMGEMTSLPPGSVLIREGEEADKVYLILEGRLEISHQSESHVFFLGEGELLGEIALLDGLPRTATATTTSECKLFGLSREQLETFLSLDPGLALSVMRVANRKVRSSLEREKQLNDSLRKVNQELERLNQDLEGLVQQKTQQLTSANQNLKEMLERDPLTGTYNRHKFNLLMQALAESRREFALIILDIDHFKRINDTHGHEAGDRVLMKVARATGVEIPEGYHLIRFGGEEFVFLLEGAGLESASAFAEKVRRSIESHHFPLRGCLPGDVTASLGVAHFPTHSDAVDRILEVADKALYQAKGAGRNRVTVAPTPGSPC